MEANNIEQMVALGDQLSSRDALRTYELHRRALHVRDNANDESTEVDDDDVDDDDSGIITDIEGRQRTPEEQKAVDAWGWAKAETWAKPAVEWKNLVCGPGPSKWEPVHIGMTSNKKSRVGRFRNSESWLLINDLRRNNTKKTGSTVTTIGAETCQHFACGLGEAAIGVCNDVSEALFHASQVKIGPLLMQKIFSLRLLRTRSRTPSKT